MSCNNLHELHYERQTVYGKRDCMTESMVSAQGLLDCWTAGLLLGNGLRMSRSRWVSLSMGSDRVYLGC
jgi:hypothetical protein